MDKNIEIIELIEKERKEQMISKKELAQAMGCSVRAINYWLKEERRISIETADKALKVLGITYTLGKNERKKR